MNDTDDKKPVIKRVDKAFLKRQKGLLRKKDVVVEELQEYVLLLMKNNGHSDFLEGIQPGEFYLKSADGKQEKSILLTPKKLTTFNYNGQYYKGWVAHEDNMSPYPEDPVHNGEMFRKTIQKVSLNYKDANDAQYLAEKRKFWIYILVGGALVIYVLYAIGNRAGWFAGNEAVVTQGAVNAVQVATAPTGVVVG